MTIVCAFVGTPTESASKVKKLLLTSTAVSDRCNHWLREMVFNLLIYMVRGNVLHQGAIRAFDLPRLLL